VNEIATLIIMKNRFFNGSFRDSFEKNEIFVSSAAPLSAAGARTQVVVSVV
jgi:hypothetical protein